jgi:hypothetical protein
VVPDRAGYLQFVVHPWAEVHINQQYVLTTPSARRVALPPGDHVVRLHNPFYAEVTREVRVSEDQTEVIEVSLEEQPDAGVPATPSLVRPPREDVDEPPMPVDEEP